MPSYPLTNPLPNSTYQKEKGYAHGFALADSGDFTAIPALMAIANVPTNPELIRASADFIAYLVLEIIANLLALLVSILIAAILC